MADLTPPNTGSEALNEYLTRLQQVVKALDLKKIPEEGWSLTDLRADVSEVISDKRDIIDVANEAASKLAEVKALVMDLDGYDQSLEEAEAFKVAAENLLDWYDQNEVSIRILLGMVNKPGGAAELIEAFDAIRIEAAQSASAAKTSETNAKASETNAASSKSAAASSASAAKTSETNTKASETNAKTSETNAKASETAANSSKSAAATSASAAKTSETNAKASETAAAGSATAAANSATAANSSKTAAATSETNTKASETNAKTSETNAKASETAANSSKSAAATSASAAKTSETNAKASETAAAGSATAAANSATAAENSANSITDGAEVATNKAAEAAAAADRAEAATSGKADLIGGKVPTSQIPEVALTKPSQVTSRTGMLALKAQEGDIAIITTGADKGTYILGTGSPTVFASWLPMAVSSDVPVQSVNGQVGTVVLSATDVGAAKATHTHTSVQITDATWDKVANSLIRRDGNGDFSVNYPSGNNSPTSKSYVDAQVATKANATHTHTSAQISDATSAPSPNTVVKRDANGLFFIQSPTGGSHPADRNYVDNKTWTSAQISDATSTATANRVVRRDTNGLFNVTTPTASAHPAPKGYVDSGLTNTYTEMYKRPALFSGAGNPPSSIPGAVVGDYWLNETTMQLRKITGVT